METEIKNLVANWRPQVISYIKEKDKLMNPEKYEEEAVSDQNASSINKNLFDDVSDDEEDLNSSNSDESTTSSPIISRKKSRLDPTDSSFEVSVDPIRENQLSNAQLRENAIDDEIARYANFSKNEFSNFCSSKGLTRQNRFKFEPVGAVAWEYWRLKKNEFPIIFATIKPILQAPTSSSAVERKFSTVSQYTTKQKNRFKSKNLMALLQIAEMDDFQRVSGEIFEQNGIKIQTDDEIPEEKTSYEESHGYDSSEENDFDDLLNFDM